MKRAAFVLVSVGILGGIPISYAKPPRPPVPPPRAPAARSPSIGKIEVTYYKPSKDGLDTTAQPKAAATLSCKPIAQQPDSNFAIVIANGQAYCKAALDDVNTAPVLCQGGGSLTTDDKFPPAIKAAFAEADACLKPSALANAVESYLPPICGTNNTGSGFIRQIKPGADTCEKVIHRMKLQTPGDAGNVLTLPTVIGAGKEITLTQAQIDSKSVKCPTGSTLEQTGNGVACKKT